MHYLATRQWLAHLVSSRRLGSPGAVGMGGPPTMHWFVDNVPCL